MHLEKKFAQECARAMSLRDIKERTAGEIKNCVQMNKKDLNLGR